MTLAPVMRIPAGIGLSWVPARDARSHRLCFGITNPPEARCTVDSPLFETGPLEPHATYYWRMDESGEPGAAPGRV